MTDSMLFGEMTQNLALVRGQYEQFIIDRERERIIKLLQARVNAYFTTGEGSAIEAAAYERAAALIKGEDK